MYKEATGFRPGPRVNPGSTRGVNLHRLTQAALGDAPECEDVGELGEHPLVAAAGAVRARVPHCRRTGPSK